MHSLFVMEAEALQENAVSATMVWTVECWQVLLRVVRDTSRRSRPWNAQSDIPGARAKLLARCKGDKNGEHCFDAAKLPDFTKKMGVIEAFLRKELKRSADNYFTNQ
jgi:hypothetical protein